jgi:hypothetical protein
VKGFITLTDLKADSLRPSPGPITSECILEIHDIMSCSLVVLSLLKRNHSKIISEKIKNR